MPRLLGRPAVKGTITLILAIVAFMLWFAIGLPRVIGFDAALADSGATEVVVGADGTVREYGYGLIRFNGHGPEWHRWQRIRETKKLEAELAGVRAENRRLRASLRRRWEPEALSMAKVACAAYEHHGGCDPKLIYRQIDCETGGTFDPAAKNPRSTASGWGQWLDFVWAGTPYAAFSRFDPMASVLAIAKAHADGNGESIRGPWAESAGCWG